MRSADRGLLRGFDLLKSVSFSEKRISNTMTSVVVRNELIYVKCFADSKAPETHEM